MLATASRRALVAFVLLAPALAASACVGDDPGATPAAEGVEAGVAEGTEGGPCFANDTCRGDLVCAKGLCERAPSGDGGGAPDSGDGAAPILDASNDGDADADAGGTPGVKRVFLTSMTYGGDLGGIGGADTKCQTAAQSGGFGAAIFKAWIAVVDGGASPATRLAHSSGPYVRTDGQRVANDWTELTSGQLLLPIDFDETGRQTTNVVAWTNTTANGLASDQDCSGWTIGNGNADGRMTTVTQTGNSLEAQQAYACFGPGGLICIEQ